MSAVTGGMCVCVCDRSVNTGGNLLCNETNILCITVQWSLTTLIIASSSCRQITCLCVFTARAGASCVYLRLMRRKKYESLNISVGKSRSCNSKNNNRMVTITCTSMLLQHLKTSVTHRWLVSVIKDVLISQWGMSFVKFKVLIEPHCFIFIIVFILDNVCTISAQSHCAVTQLEVFSLLRGDATNKGGPSVANPIQTVLIVPTFCHKLSLMTVNEITLSQNYTFCICECVRVRLTYISPLEGVAYV